MFGRRRHAAAVPAAPVPQLSEAQILDVVHEKIAELIGERGEWTVSRRTENDTDAIFHSVLAQSVSLDIATALFDAKRRLEGGEDTTADIAETSIVEAAEPQHLAVPVEAPVTAAAEADSGVETGGPSAFGWEPAPITVWTDLRKPVTGEIPTILPQRAAA